MNCANAEPIWYSLLGQSKKAEIYPLIIGSVADEKGHIVGNAIWKAALIGAAHGVAECAILFLASERYTLSKDWFLGVMEVFANASGFAIAARSGVSLIGVALAGLAGMMVGGWVGFHTIGNYEYTVPTEREDHVLRIVTKGQEREIELKGLPNEKVKGIPIGGGIGVLVGWAVGAGLFAWLARARPENSEADDEVAGVDGSASEGDRGRIESSGESNHS